MCCVAVWVMPSFGKSIPRRSSYVQLVEVYLPGAVKATLPVRIAIYRAPN